jgi:hypothetical protein
VDTPSIELKLEFLPFDILKDKKISRILLPETNGGANQYPPLGTAGKIGKNS